MTTMLLKNDFNYDSDVVQIELGPAIPILMKCCAWAD